MATQGSDARYAHLLEPIRNLAENWAIDIAHELNDYLAELQAITISFQDGGPTLDFAEAALLIQGSTCVYSKKVEHLYALVYHTLNQVVEKKRSAAQPAATTPDGGGDSETADLFAATDNEAFLTLDDMLEEESNISLPPPPLTASAAAAFTVARTPLHLAPATKGEDGGFKLANSHIHSSGALLLPSVFLPSSMLSTLTIGSVAASPAPGLETGLAKSPGFAQGDDDDDADFADTGYPEEDWGDMPCESASDGAIARVASSEAAEPPKSPPPDRKRDPWAPLDPHDAGGASLSRPFRKGRTYSAANASAAAARAEAAFASETFGNLAEACAPPRSADDEKENAASAGGTQAASASSGSDVFKWLRLRPLSATDAVPLRAPLFAQFDGLYDAEAKRRGAERKAARALAAQREHVSEQPEADAEAGELYFAAHSEGVAEGAIEPFLPDDNDVAPLDFEGAFGADNDDDDSGTGSGRSEHIASYEEACREHVETCLQASSSYAEDADLYLRVSEWKARIEPCLQEQGWRATFDVNECADRILDHFDENERVFARAKQPRRADESSEKVVPFAELAQSSERWEVCRMFLAALQLTNEGNVAIHWDGGAGMSALEELSLEKLSDERETILERLV